MANAASIELTGLEELIVRLGELDRGGALAVVDRAVARGATLDQVITGLLAPAQVDLGRLWAAHELGPVEAQAAAAIVRIALGRAAPPAGSSERPVVAVGCPDGERHELPAEMVTESLRAHGWPAESIGVPASGLREYLERRRPVAVLLSCTTPCGLAGAARAIDVAHHCGVGVIVGGAAFGRDDLRALRLGAGGWAPTATAATTILTRWQVKPPDMPLGRALSDNFLALEAALPQVRGTALDALRRSALRRSQDTAELAVLRDRLDLRAGPPGRRHPARRRRAVPRFPGLAARVLQGQRRGRHPTGPDARGRQHGAAPIAQRRPAPARARLPLRQPGRPDAPIEADGGRPAVSNRLGGGGAGRRGCTAAGRPGRHRVGAAGARVGRLLGRLGSRPRCRPGAGVRRSAVPRRHVVPHPHRLDRSGPGRRPVEHAELRGGPPRGPQRPRPVRRGRGRTRRRSRSRPWPAIPSSAAAPSPAGRSPSASCTACRSAAGRATRSACSACSIAAAGRWAAGSSRPSWPSPARSPASWRSGGGPRRRRLRRSRPPPASAGASRYRKGPDAALADLVGLRRAGFGVEQHLLRSHEVAVLFDVTERTVINWAAAQKLSSLRTAGGHLRFRSDDVLALLDKRAGSATG